MRISDWSSDVCSSDLVRLTRALEVAERYAPEKVTNLMAVTGSQQVMLAVRFAEVQRRLVKELGLNTQVSNSDFVISAGDALLNGVFSATAFARSDERRVGKECVSTCRSRWSPYH